ncbi:PPR repeat protein [Medicago truncatula]|uniref:PPR repeat protein n=1 Tax=Medicago truncatula TaxID=3880 RepID=G7KPQ3_MEDTR|nr:PPR repeat protein [Medicago truncatula]
MIRQVVEPNVVTYTSLMDGYFLVKEVNKATYVFNTIARSGVIPYVQSYNITLTNYVRIKWWMKHFDE